MRAGLGEAGKRRGEAERSGGIPQDGNREQGGVGGRRVVHETRGNNGWRESESAWKR